MRVNEIDELESRISQLKNELIQTAETTGLNSHETLYCSRKLDQHITNYQILSFKKAN
jgi:stage 0 sporulation regulatory protein